MVRAWCRRIVLGFQDGDTVCTIDTIGSAYLLVIGSDVGIVALTRVHKTDGAHGAHGVTHLICQYKNAAPWVHHRHHRIFCNTIGARQRRVPCLPPVAISARLLRDGRNWPDNSRPTDAISVGLLVAASWQQVVSPYCCGGFKRAFKHRRLDASKYPHSIYKTLTYL